MAKVTRADIDTFLRGKRMAVIGVSRNPKEYSRKLFQELIKHKIDAVPVNPNADEMDGVPCFNNIRDISPAPDRAVILLPEDLTEQAVLDCAGAGVKDVWLHRHVAGGVSDTRAIFRAEEKGIRLITGYCMFMFLPKAALFHKIHGAIMRLVGIYPK